MNEVIDLISIADQIATTNPKVNELKVGQTTLVHTSKLSKKYPKLSKLDINIIKVGKTNNGAYGKTLELWEVDNIPTVVQVNGIDLDTNRVVIKSVQVGKSTGIGIVAIDGVDLKIIVNLTDDCLLEYAPKPGVLTDLPLDELAKNLSEKPDNFTKVNDSNLPLNTPIKIVEKSGVTKKFEVPVYKATYILNDKLTVIERLLPDARLRVLIDSGTTIFFIGARYQKTDKTTGQILTKVKIFDSNNPKLDDIDLEV